jgi:hypothetical protein
MNYESGQLSVLPASCLKCPGHAKRIARSDRRPFKFHQDLAESQDHLRMSAALEVIE